MVYFILKTNKYLSNLTSNSKGSWIISIAASDKQWLSWSKGDDTRVGAIVHGGT